MKEYISPKVRLISLDGETLLATSGENRVGTIRGYNVVSDNEAYSNGRDEDSRGIWDE